MGWVDPWVELGWVGSGHTKWTHGQLWLVFLQAEWIPMLTDCTSVSVALSSASRYDAVHEVSSNDWAVGATPNDPMLILFRVRTCHMPKEAESSLSLSLSRIRWETGGQPVVCRDGTGSHFVTKRPSHPGIQRPGDPDTQLIRWPCSIMTPNVDLRVKKYS